MNAEYRKTTCDRAVAEKMPAFTARHNDGRALSGVRKGDKWSLSLEPAHGWVTTADPDTGASKSAWSPKSPPKERAVSDAELAKAVEEMCS